MTVIGKNVQSYISLFCRLFVFAQVFTIYTTYVHIIQSCSPSARRLLNYLKILIIIDLYIVCRPYIIS